MSRSQRSLVRSATVLGPVEVAGCTVRLRPPRLGDFADWRAIRIRDRAIIEPYWVSSPYSWDERHTLNHWIRERLDHRQKSRRGRSLALAIEANGRFAGLCGLNDIDFRAGSAELSVWVSSEVADRGVGTVSVTLLIDHGLDVLGLDRVTAPICTENGRASRGAEFLGLRREALMRGYLDVGGQRKDHILFAATSIDPRPAGGFTAGFLRHVRGDLALVEKRRGSAESESSGRPSPARTAVAIAGYYIGVLRAGCRRRLRRRQVVTLCPSRDELVSLTPVKPPNAVKTFAHPADSRDADDYLRFVVGTDVGVSGRAALGRIDQFTQTALIGVDLDSGPGQVSARVSILRLLIGYGFGPLGLQRLWMAIDGSDREMVAAARQVGMRNEGRMRNYRGRNGRLGDHQLWALTAPAR